MATALPLCTARPSLCHREEGALRSPVRIAVPPHKARPHALRVSIAMGAKIKSPDETSWAYLMFLRASVFAATDPAASEDCLRYDDARVSRQVKSPTK